MQVDFHASRRGTVGIEWELALVDSQTLKLVPAADGLLSELGVHGDDPIRKEYLQNMIEVVSQPHQRVADAVDDVADRLAEVRVAARAQGVSLLGAGCHPFSRASEQKPFSSPRYDVVTERNQWWGRQMAICGIHVHVGLTAKEYALPVVDVLSRFYPFFLALSASSPFWEGDDTGYASQRTMLFQQLPTNGLPWQFTEWSQFEDFVTGVTQCSMISSASEIRWDVRPAPRFGTVENRTADSVGTLAEIGTLAALTQCLTEFTVRELDAGRGLVALEPWFIKENKWRAARYGLDAEMITSQHRHRVRPVRECLDEWIDRLHPVAHDLGCTGELEFAAELSRRGAPYERQRALAADADLYDLTRRLVDETGAEAPSWQADAAHHLENSQDQDR
ncbi:carboxylate-amine ligase [Propionibacterium cyclohexanicum]|uniref:Putative glutamate--cysteine ligase 2 n=1 Tax=Propionibacterium cyclohexanicum TaxID=64702 RepID=A0A1H9SIX9_9ACTN|nr:glutamate--cysteine ligase [Propionibacterium cyclohexanicum]SER84996.1 carboxylate-amine ligase [Propionibacterium cyclohexanicum]